MANNGRGKKHDYGIVGYNPEKVGEEYKLVMYKCPHCWYESRNKSVLGRHIKKEHWDLLTDATGPESEGA